VVNGVTVAEEVNVEQSSFYPEQVAKLYNFPAGDGTGQTVAIIELGGGYNLSDLNTYAMGRNLPLPNVTSINIGSGTNDTSDADASGEVCLDIEIIASIVPKAKILVYFAGNTDMDFSNAIAAAVSNPDVKVISISWGGPESGYPTQSIAAFEQDFQKAINVGTNIFVASGDSGSNDGTKNPVTDFPSSSSSVISCGGSEITVSNSKITNEVVWNDGPNQEGGAGGGGFSKIIPRPAYQSNIGGKEVEEGRRPKPHPIVNTGRGAPDLAMNASPNVGYIISVNGDIQVIGGTSAVAPLVSALILLINQNLNKNVGWLNPILYKNTSVFNDIVEGNNGAYRATKGWDAASGNGSIDGTKLLEVIKTRQ
jgi:kumamolisin